MPANKRDSHFLPCAASGRLCRSDCHVLLTVLLYRYFDQSPPSKSDCPGCYKSTCETCQHPNPKPGVQTEVSTRNSACAHCGSHCEEQTEQIKEHIAGHFFAGAFGLIEILPMLFDSKGNWRAKPYNKQGNAKPRSELRPKKHGG